METFVWDRHFTTGIEPVDSQHRELVHLINRIGESLMEGDSVAAESLGSTFRQLADCAQQHFSEEEKLMLDAGLAQRSCELHRLQHAQFMNQLATMWQARAWIAQPAETLHGFLRSWLGFHILGEDQSMARQIALIRSGQSPDEAFAIEQAREDNAAAALLQTITTLYRVLAQQNADLASANLELERRVEERTQELALANQALIALNVQLEEQSNRDGLLGIANRRYFDARLNEEWRRAKREGHPLSLLMLDVDHFKRYNDLYGHPAGDRCLQAVARAASSPVVLKRPGDLVARYGGEELAVILPNTDTEGAVLTAQHMQRVLSEMHIAHADSSVGAEVTVSVGAATLRPDKGDEATALLAAADRALYAAKLAGRNRVSVEAPAKS